MYHINMIQKSLDYIEDNLKSELSIAELADLAGYSLWQHRTNAKIHIVGKPFSKKQ